MSGDVRNYLVQVSDHDGSWNVRRAKALDEANTESFPWQSVTPFSQKKKLKHEDIQ